MKLHTKLTVSDVQDALAEEKANGRVSRLVGFEILEERGSRSHTRAFSVQLGWYGSKEVGDGPAGGSGHQRGAGGAFQ